MLRHILALLLVVSSCLASEDLEITDAGKVFSTAAKKLAFPAELEKFRSNAVKDSWGTIAPSTNVFVFYVYIMFLVTHFDVYVFILSRLMAPSCRTERTTGRFGCGGSASG
jgi:hypothetical protein